MSNVVCHSAAIAFKNIESVTIMCKLWTVTCFVSDIYLIHQRTLRYIPRPYASNFIMVQGRRTNRRVLTASTAQGHLQLQSHTTRASPRSRVTRREECFGPELNASPTPPVTHNFKQPRSLSRELYSCFPSGKVVILPIKTYFENQVCTLTPFEASFSEPGSVGVRCLVLSYSVKNKEIIA